MSLTHPSLRARRVLLELIGQHVDGGAGELPGRDSGHGPASSPLPEDWPRAPSPGRAAARTTTVKREIAQQVPLGDRRLRLLSSVSFGSAGSANDDLVSSAPVRSATPVDGRELEQGVDLGIPMNVADRG